MCRKPQSIIIRKASYAAWPGVIVWMVRAGLASSVTFLPSPAPPYLELTPKTQECEDRRPLTIGHTKGCGVGPLSGPPDVARADNRLGLDVSNLHCTFLPSEDAGQSRVTGRAGLDLRQDEATAVGVRLSSSDRAKPIYSRTSFRVPRRTIR